MASDRNQKAPSQQERHAFEQRKRVVLMSLQDSCGEGLEDGSFV